MRKIAFVLAAMCAAASGCASSAQPTPTVAATRMAPAAAEATLGEETTEPALADVTDTLSMVDEAMATQLPDSTLAGLPEAPWEGEALDPSEAGVALDAWASSENRGFCAPLLPRDAGVTNARMRASALEGGWSIEYDHRGSRGVDEDGEVCRRCGRSSFGVAGIGMAPEDMYDLEQDSLRAPSYSDGSVTERMPVEDGVASATITVQGQGCVYQVWSFLGEAHLEQLLAQLRFVDVPTEMGESAVATNE